MADRVSPTVRLIFPCDAATFDLGSEKWVLTHPRSVVLLPAGATFPFRASELCVYAHLAEGLGTFDVCVELAELRDDGSRRVIGMTPSTRMTFPAGQRLLATDTAFRLRRVPFRRAGLYEFRVVADLEPEGFRPVAGQAALLRVFDQGGV